MNIPLFDAHCDTAFQMVLKGYGLFENTGHTDLRRGLKYSPYAQFFALFAMDEAEMPKRFPHISGIKVGDLFELELKTLLFEFENLRDCITLCKTARDAQNAAASGRAAAFLSIEGAELIGCKIDKLYEMKSCGVSSLTLSWNKPNALVSDTGLTALGREFVRCCNELSILIDVSHLGEKAFWDVMDLTASPVIASHSNSRALCEHSRNLTDEQFRAICELGGVAGINLYTEFLGENPTVDTVISHIEHFLSLGGERNIAIGTDFDGCDSLPEGISGIEDIEAVYNELLRRDYPLDLVNGIFYDNLMRVVGEVCVT
ncbi:MAG TPA: membrane dipeptidase [Clostridiales bacterium]|jgi:membrane dipeptidase|nr:membrane dipeptidase [Clostridiales bacterium]